MKILIVASDKGGHFAPFIEEQITALQEIGVQVVRYAVTGKGIFGYLCELPALKQMIRAEQPDVVHAHYGLCGLLANLQRRVHVVTTYHGSDINVPKILRFSKIAMRLSAWNIFVSQRNVALALGEAQAKCKAYSVERIGQKDGIAESSAQTPNTKHQTPNYSLIPCGVNLTDDQLLSRSEARRILGISEDETIILFAGAFNNAVKDAPLAQASVASVTHPPSTIHHTPILQELRGFSRAEVNCWMCAANALLMTSKTEGSPQVVKEAMACGCPIVSVDVGDVAERIEGVEGCHVVPTREPRDIANALSKAIEFEGKTNGRERIIEMELTNKQVAERLMAIYRDI